MNREQVLHLVPYVVSLAVLAGILAYAVRRPYLRAVRPLGWMIFGQILTVSGYLLELVSFDLESKILWDSLQWMTFAFLVLLPMLAFAAEFSGHRFPLPPLTWGILVAMPVVFCALLLTNDSHQFINRDPRLIARGPFPRLSYELTLITFVYLILYVYGVQLYAIILLLRTAFSSHNEFRPQYMLAAAGLIVPLVLSLFSLVDMQIAPQQDLTPIGFAAGSLLAAWGLFHYGLFDISPLAREQAIQHLEDAVIVLDPRDRIVDANRAALALVGKQRSGVLGQPIQRIFTGWSALLEALRNPVQQRMEISVSDPGSTRELELGISQIPGNRRQVLGRILIIRDVTRQRMLETNVRTLSAEIEQRVQTRTEELFQTAAHYRGIVEHQTDLIVRWRPDGTRTFVNEAYCRYWDISQEQALAINFLFHAPHENRPQAEEIVSHLNSGAMDVETETHQVVRPDGTIAWQEWVDTAIRDEWGKLIEILSVGRDITRRAANAE